jgi:hypothetical protein
MRSFGNMVFGKEIDECGVRRVSVLRQTEADAVGYLGRFGNRQTETEAVGYLKQFGNRLLEEGVRQVWKKSSLRSGDGERKAK